MTTTSVGLTGEPPSLLLFTVVPSHISLASLKAAYYPALVQCLGAASSKSRDIGQTKVLDIAMPYNEQDYAENNPQNSRYRRLQDLTGHMYKLICTTCTQLNIDVDHDNDVDARVILYDKTMDDRVCALSIHSLGVSQKPWDKIMVLRAMEEDPLLQAFLHIRQNSQPIEIINVQADWTATDASFAGKSEYDDGPFVENNSGVHFSVAVGGTFDHLHVGHKLLLTMTALVLEPTDQKDRTLTIGITGDSLLTKKQYVEELQIWIQRQASVRDFLLSILEQEPPKEPVTSNLESSPRHVQEKLDSGLIINYVEIFDPFGPTITDEAISALVVSAETRAGGKAVNDKRIEKGWAPLEVFEVAVLDAMSDRESGSAATDFQAKISSTEIRRRLQLRHARRTAMTA